MKIAILLNESDTVHSTNWSFEWVKYCEINDILYEIIDPYERGVIGKLAHYEIILWHYSNYLFTDLLIAKNILFSLELSGKIVFPSIRDCWHFDDKLAETYLLESINAPIPASYYFYEKNKVLKNELLESIHFPIIAKLRNGSGSHNVKKISNKNELVKYNDRIFNFGIDSSPSLFYKTSSNLRSTKNISMFIKRFKRIPEFLRSLSNAKKFNLERGYLFLQDFIVNDGFDLKIVVVGNKLSFVCRNIRKGEFRASGSGDIFYDKSKITSDIINSAFETSDKLGFLCMGYDYVVNRNNGQGVIIEISYGFSHSAILDCGGYFDRKGNWVDEPLNVPFEILKNLIFRYEKTQNH